MNISIYIQHKGKWFSSPVCVNFDFLPRIGESISLEDFFPKFIAESWEVSHKISPFGKVSDVVFTKGQVQITVDA